MSMKFNQGRIDTNRHIAVNSIDDSIVEKVWRDLDGQLSYEQVSHVVAEIALGYQNAKVKAFLPILIHREALEQLKGCLEACSSV